jgi:hypothetical protein
MGQTYIGPSIDEYLRKWLMPMEGASPYVQGIEMYGNSIPAGTVGGDPFLNISNVNNLTTSISAFSGH